MNSDLSDTNKLFGFLNIYKPQGLTSHDVVARLRKVLKIKQIGHTGTLDPLAQGVLPVAAGKASRLIEYLDEGKAYIAEICFGKISDTYDTEGTVVDFSDKKVCADELREALLKFKGEIEQTPPAYSAVHYNGKRLYELAREGIIPENIPKRKVVIEEIDLLDFDEKNQTAKINVVCSKGTYIRSIVHDIGQGLGCGAVMSGLLRTKSGRFDIKTAVKLEDITDLQTAQKYLQNPVEILPFGKYNLSEAEFARVKHGNALITKSFKENEFVSLIYNTELVAIAQKKDAQLTVKKVFI